MVLVFNPEEKMSYQKKSLRSHMQSSPVQGGLLPRSEPTGNAEERRTGTGPTFTFTKGKKAS